MYVFLIIIQSLNPVSLKLGARQHWKEGHLNIVHKARKANFNFFSGNYALKGFFTELLKGFQKEMQRR